MGDNEYNIIIMITKGVKISKDSINDFLKYLNKIQMSDSVQFDTHCSIVNKLSEEDFVKYIKFLNNVCKKKGA